MVGFPNNHGFFYTKNDHFGVFWGYHHLREHPYLHLKYMCIYYILHTVHFIYLPKTPATGLHPVEDRNFSYFRRNSRLVNIVINPDFYY